MNVRRLTRTESAIQLIFLTTVLGIVAVPVSDLIYDLLIDFDDSGRTYLDVNY